LSPKRFERELIQGYLHEPTSPTGAAIAITHGAGGNCDAPLLRALAQEFSEAGWFALRYDLPYRQARPKGPPFPAQAARDRDGVRAAAAALREFAPKIYLSGSSYGGRQTSMAAAEDAKLAHALLLLSYPLHPPGKPEKPRTEHFPDLQIPTLFAHGSRDAFASLDELAAAAKLIRVRTAIFALEGAPHGLPASCAGRIKARFSEFVSL